MKLPYRDALAGVRQGLSAGNYNAGQWYCSFTTLRTGGSLPVTPKSRNSGYWQKLRSVPRQEFSMSSYGKKTWKPERWKSWRGKSWEYSADRKLGC